jgi:septal ring factor EnvC (AmiA/AmiB activator)
MITLFRPEAPTARRPGWQAFTLAALASALMATTLAHAEPNSREREALRRAQQSLRDAQAERDAIVGEKAALASDKGKLEGELKQVAAKVRGAESQAAGLKARVAQLEASLAEQQKAVADGQAREAALAEQIRVTEAKLAEQVRVVGTVQALLAERTREAQTLNGQNQAMYKAGLDAIELYRAQSPTGFLQSRDKLLGWENVKVENVAETLRDRMDDARYKALPTETTAAGRVN